MQEHFMNGEAKMARAEKVEAETVEHGKDWNPKVDPDGAGASNQIKDPDDWVTGGEPMTGAQASYLKTLSEQAKAPDAFDPGLDKAEASKRIDALKEETGR